MTLSLDVVQALAPDQGSLVAAGKLLQPKHWLRVARAAGLPVIWGECQGSGAHPYRVIADVADHGYKCTCPSRKFPCKHSLALMWQYAESAERFGQAEVPDWVQEWLGRRRRAGASGDAAPGVAGKDIAVAQATEPADPQEAEAQARKREAAAAKRQAQTHVAVGEGLGELQQWIADQLRTGVAGLLDDVVARCRRIAARLVDSKAAALASRVDEWPARVLALPRELRGEAAMLELGQWVLLAQAWRAAPDDPDARAAVIQASTREEVLASTATRAGSLWEVMGHAVQTRRDGMVSQSTWLLDRCSATPRFALLLDFFPASAGRRGAALAPGQRLQAELAFYPSRHPLRAVIATQGEEPAEETAGIAAVGFEPAADPLQTHREHLARLPWASHTPLHLGPGRVLEDGQGQLWWRGDEGGALRLAPLANAMLWQALPLRSAVAVWDGLWARLIQVETALGKGYPDD
ncbi:SWIM zinc finger family protein [Dyella lutea]|uniref:SWIM zinc finger family protein n=1 Tax=Dyella lutea TaxID=2950441 RepID=A0ABT1FG06_9GAMM|nr:SWIM zinc finger family protein [Dyella lutea]MCP1376324.1 SWIM zinc finger family protein [Dyella lutea]